MRHCAEDLIGEYVSYEDYSRLYNTLKFIAGLYKSDVAPFDSMLANDCWDEVIEMAREAIKQDS